MPSILSSWKEIASYVGRSVRTVQRWEREIGLPVHRPTAKNEGVVVALPAELDAWVRSMPTNSHLDADDATDNNGNRNGNGNSNARKDAVAVSARGNGGASASKSNRLRRPVNGKVAARPIRATPRPSA